MTTHINFESANAPSISPAFSALWGVTTNAQRRKCGLAGSIADNTVIGGSSFPETSGTPVDVLGVQFTTVDTIPDNRTIGTGTFSAVFHIYETSAQADGFLQMVIKVMSGDGATLRGVLYAGNAATTAVATVGATNEELTLTPGATRVYVNVGMTPVAAQTGDVIVIEVGCHMCNTQTTSRGFFLRRGYDNANSEYALTSGLTTTVVNPWVEFSEDIFDPTPPPTGGVFASLGSGTQISAFPNGGLVTSASDLCASRAHTGYVYVQNDAGDVNRVFMVQLSDGTVDATLTLTGATNTDWTDAAFHAGQIFVADIGNAAGTRTDQCLWAFTEPTTIGDQAVATTRYPITIAAPGTALDAECFMIRPSDGATFIYLKANATNSNSGLYQGPNVGSLSTSSANTFTRVANFSLNQVTAGDFSNDGRYFILTTNGTDATFPTTGGMYVYDASTNTEIGRFAGNVSGGGNHPAEGICWALDDAFVYRTFNGGGTKANCPIYRYPVNYTTDTGGTLTASAGSDITGVGGLHSVALVASATGGSGGYSYSWAQTAGTTVTLAGTGATRTFRAPGEFADGTLTFRVTVTDGASNTDTDDITVSYTANTKWRALGGVLVPCFADTGVDQSGGDPLPQIPTISAETFQQSWGVRIFPTQDSYVTLQTDHSWLTTLKPRFVTQKLLPNMDPDVIALIQNLAAEGTKSVLTLGEPMTQYNDSQWLQMIGYLKNELAGCILMVNGQNEVNHVRGGGALPGDWMTQASEHLKKIYRYIVVGGTISTTYYGTTSSVNYGTSVNTALAAGGHDAILVGNCNLWSGNIAIHNTDLDTLAPLITGFFNQINYHLYPRGTDPTWNLDSFITKYRGKFGNLPVWCTEAGYFAAPNYTGTAIGVTPYAHNIYSKKMKLEYALRNCKVSQFEFLNSVNPAGDNREDWFGLVKVTGIPTSTWSPQPAYTSITHMNQIHGGTAGTIGCIITTSGNVQRLLVNHSSGTRLYLWRRDNVELNLTPIPITPVSVTVTSLNGGVQVVSVSDDVVEVDL